MTKPNSVVRVGAVEIGNDKPFVLIAGPDSMESRDHAFEMASALQEITSKLGVGFIYKSSFDKANRTSGSAFRGLGMDVALPIFAELTEKLGVPTTTDVHTEEQCARVAEAVTLLQIPAFLSRQTSLLEAAARTGNPVNVKKGQFLAPWDMVNVVAKVTDAGNSNVLVTERGTTFGYGLLVNDMRSLVWMRETGAPIVYDATHSVQRPSGLGNRSGGDRDMIPHLARAAVAVGVAAVFMETHQDPDNAPCDGPNMLYLRDMEELLTDLVALDKVAKRVRA